MPRLVARRSSIFGPIRATRGAILPDAELDELAASIQSKGLIQPVVVRRVGRQAGAL